MDNNIHIIYKICRGGMYALLYIFFNYFESLKSIKAVLDDISFWSQSSASHYLFYCPICWICSICSIFSICSVQFVAFIPTEGDGTYPAYPTYRPLLKVTNRSFPILLQIKTVHEYLIFNKSKLLSSRSDTITTIISFHVLADPRHQFHSRSYSSIV